MSAETLSALAAALDVPVEELTSQELGYPGSPSPAGREIPSLR
jgi:hypothetical protein